MDIQVNVFSQGRQNRVFVGKLWREDNCYFFKYQYKYLKKKTAIPIGPDVPLQLQPHRSQTLFESLLDRIPSKDNPSYADYCKQWGVDPKEQDVLILLTTIGQRGPSSFLFRKDPQMRYTSDDIKRFRTQLGLTVRDFGAFLDVEFATLSRTERAKNESKQLLSFCELLDRVPAALDYQLHKRGQFLHDEKIRTIKEVIDERRTAAYSRDVESVQHK